MPGPSSLMAKPQLPERRRQALDADLPGAGLEGVQTQVGQRAAQVLDAAGQAQGGVRLRQAQLHAGRALRLHGGIQGEHEFGQGKCLRAGIGAVGVGQHVRHQAFELAQALDQALGKARLTVGIQRGIAQMAGVDQRGCQRRAYLMCQPGGHLAEHRQRPLRGQLLLQDIETPFELAVGIAQRARQLVERGGIASGIDEGQGRHGRCVLISAPQGIGAGRPDLKQPPYQIIFYLLFN